MNIQSLSVVVPNKKCINNCEFCVARMHTEDYQSQIDENLPSYDLYLKEYKRRLEFARDNGCNTIMLTGNTEPQQNKSFLKTFGEINNNLQTPFRWIEMQTTGVFLSDTRTTGTLEDMGQSYLRFLRSHVGVSTISLSMSSLDSDVNAEINGTPNNLKVNIQKLCSDIKQYDFNLRLSLNLTNEFDIYIDDITDLFYHCRKVLHADQITFRVLQAEDNDTPQAQWVRKNKANDKLIKQIKEYITTKGKPLEILPYGAQKYDVHEMGIVLDSDSQATEVKSDYKYLVLRPDCKLYSKWDSKASLIF